MNRNCLEFNNFEKQNVRRAGVCLIVSTAVAKFVLENSDVYGTERCAPARAFCLFFSNLFDRQNSVSVENHHQNRRAVTEVNRQLEADGNIPIPVDLLRPSRITYLKDSGNLFYGTEEWYEHFIKLECIFRQYVDNSIQFKNPRKELLKILELPV
ncbi:hypothetical protein RvY_05872 [Ramazzottius varieornatus]|uniref:Uncharacterized protein n=1 Tax=Ramazzottius varieornatus TaxID=947166 RepID=A0A1D1UWM4_RAMVA|nr:hypothetical protein RvY_05872 [Ramazzottius varieornatus]